MKNILLILILLTSCKVTNKVYFYNTNEIDDGEFSKENLYLFFTKNSRVEEKFIRSKKLKKELKKIKKKISNNGGNDDNDYFYDFAIITSANDTLYSNSLVIWNHNGKVKRIENKNIKEIINRYF
jgi:hypothetical protein